MNAIPAPRLVGVVEIVGLLFEVPPTAPTPPPLLLLPLPLVIVTVFAAMGGELTNVDMQVAVILPPFKPTTPLLLLLLLLLLECMTGLVIKEQLLLDELSPNDNPLLLEVPTTALLVLVGGGWRRYLDEENKYKTIRNGITLSIFEEILSKNQEKIQNKKFYQTKKSLKSSEKSSEGSSRYWLLTN